MAAMLVKFFGEFGAAVPFQGAAVSEPNGLRQRLEGGGDDRVVPCVERFLFGRRQGRGGAAFCKICPGLVIDWDDDVWGDSLAVRRAAGWRVVGGDR